MLIRFFRTKEYAESFLCGKLFCNSLNYFRTYPDITLDGNKLSEDKCTDLFEGSAQIIRKYFPYEEFKEHIGCDPPYCFFGVCKSSYLLFFFYSNFNTKRYEPVWELVCTYI